MTAKTWRAAIVVGASSGIGEASARRLAAEGVKVAVVARRGERLRALRDEIEAAKGPIIAVREHDVRDGEDVPKLWDGIEREIGPVDLIIFASGIMPAVGADEFSFGKDREILDVNLIGAVAWLDEAALRMQAVKRGTIVGVSSVAGDRGRRGSPAYATSKAALNTFLEALRNRLTQHGVDVITVRPGYVETPMTEGLGLPAKAMISADRAAMLLLRAARGGPADVYVPWPWRYVMFVIRSIPSFIFRKLSV